MRWPRALAVVLVAVAFCFGTALAVADTAQWTVHEVALVSASQYEQPLWDVRVSVQLTSPSGRQDEVEAFWYEGRTWMFRFSPDEIGTWQWQTQCSDQANASLHGRKGSSPHPNGEVTDAVVLGLAKHVDEVGRPLCPCNYYPDKQTEVDSSRRWFCACDEMKRYKYCHCLLFVTPEGMPITEYLPEDHEGHQIYGLVKDPTPDKGREARAVG